MSKWYAITPPLMAALLLPAGLLAQEQTEVNARVDSVFATYDRPDSPGCALGVYQAGEMVYARGYGMANLELDVPIGPATVFDIGSTSKQFTTASLVLLEQQGQLSLDDDIRKYLPELRDYGSPITIRHLLHHTSGLRDYIGIMTMGGFSVDDVTGNDEALAAIVRQQALNFETGAEHLYSNSGYFLASMIVQRASGKSLRQFAAEHIFGPLRMTHTLYRDDHTELVPRRAVAYASRQGGGYRMDVSNWEQLGDGAVFTSVEDLLLWDRNFYDPRVGGSALLEELHTRGRLNSGDSLSYALGLVHGEHRGLRTVSHGGAWGGYRAELLRFPSEQFSVGVLCNLASSNPTQLARRVAELFLADRLQPVTVATSRPTSGAAGPTAQTVQIAPTTLRSWAGSYRNPATSALRTLVFEGDSLLVEVPSGRFALRPVDERELAVEGQPVRLRFDEGANPRLHQVSESGEQIFERYEPWRPGADALRALAGEYYSAELDATYTLAAAGDTLHLQRKRSPRMRLRPIVTDELAAGSLTLRIQRDDAGQVTGFLLDAGRVRGLKFVRRTG